MDGGVREEDLCKGLKALDANFITNFDNLLDPRVVAISRSRIDWLNSVQDDKNYLKAVKDNITMSFCWKKRVNKMEEIKNRFDTTRLSMEQFRDLAEEMTDFANNTKKTKTEDVIIHKSVLDVPEEMKDQLWNFFNSMTQGEDGVSWENLDEGIQELDALFANHLH